MGKLRKEKTLNLKLMFLFLGNKTPIILNWIKNGKVNIN